MSEELIQKDLINNPAKIGKWDFYNIGATTIKQLKENGIIRNVDYGKEEKKKVDALIVQKKNVIAVIEYKKPSEFNTKAKKQKAIKQEITVAQKLKANILIATDSKESVWINVATGNEIKDENKKPLKYNFDFNDERLPELIEKIINSINEKNDQIKPKNLVNPTDLAKQIWQDIWSVSGATPENCLYTFVELFIFKYLSDLGVLKGLHNFDNLLKMYETNTEDEVLQYYADTIRKKIKELFPKNDIDNTTIINGTIFVSKDQKAVAGYSTVFKKVLLKFRDYGKLEHIDYDFKSQLFESFLKESISKKNWGQFFTPLKVVRAIVEMTKDDIKDGVSICDPACGVGKFLLEPIKTKLDQFYKVEKNYIKPKITIHGFDKGFDKDEQKTIILAKANMLIYFSDLIKDNPGLTKNFAELFNESFTLKTNSILGTLADPVQEEYDLILTNPPYVTSGSSNLKEEIKKVAELENYYKVNAMGVEGLFMEWIVRALKPNGKAFIVVPDGILNRQNDAKLRKFLLDECFIDAIISLPEKTFFTTIKKTYILALTKKADKKIEQIDPVFTYLVSEIGETRDVYRFDIEQNDLQEAVTLFSFFKGNKSNFDKINTDKRCKIQSFNKFKENINNSWIIDDWWTKEEKIELGIEEQEQFIKFEEFPQLLEEVANNIKSLQEEINILIEKREYINKNIKLSDFLNFQDGFSFPSSIYTQSHNAIKLIRIQDVNKKSKIKEVRIPRDFSFNNPNNKYWVNKGDYLLSLSGAAGFNLIKWEGEEGYLNQRITKITLKDEYSDSFIPEYVETIFKIIYDEINQLGKGANNNLNKKDILKINISIPIKPNGEFDLEAQKEIANKYKKIEEIKKIIDIELRKIEETKIDYE